MNHPASNLNPIGCIHDGKNYVNTYQQNEKKFGVKCYYEDCPLNAFPMSARTLYLAVSKWNARAIKHGK